MLHGDSDGQGLVREVRCATWIHWADGVRMGFSFSQKPLGVPVAIVVVVIIIILLVLVVVVVFASLSSQFSQSPFCTRKLIVKSPFFAYAVTSIITFNLIILGRLVDRGCWDDPLVTVV